MRLVSRLGPPATIAAAWQPKETLLEATALRARARGRDVRRRLVRLVAAVAATGAIGLGLTAAPAGAQPNDPCATATAIFHARLNQAGALLEAADRLADAGYEQQAQETANRADFYLNLAEESLSNMTAWC
jgi:hypothetical protein